MDTVEQVEQRILEATEIGRSLLSRGASSIKSTVNKRVAELKKVLEDKKKEETIDESKTTN